MFIFSDQDYISLQDIPVRGRNLCGDNDRRLFSVHRVIVSKFSVVVQLTCVRPTRRNAALRCYAPIEKAKWLAATACTNIDQMLR